MVEITYTKEDEKRFWSKVKLPEMIGADACWEWQAGKDGGGYGRFEVNNKVVWAHQFAYLTTTEEIPDGLCICHSCDIPACVNPSHLWLGTHADNMRDMIQKGRAVHQKGENHPGHKLIEEDVREIRDLYKTGLYTQQQIANLFNVSRKQISYIINYKRWSHIP